MGDVSNSPVIVYAAIIFGVLVIIASAIPRILGPLGTAFSEWAQRRRRVATESDDARVADLRKDVEYLKDAVSTLRGREDARDVLARSHRAWDVHLVARLIELDPTHPMPDPPPLYPPL